MRRIATMTSVAVACAFAAAPAPARQPGDAPPAHVQELVQTWSSADSWDSISPADLDLPLMTPFRAVYERSYGSGDGARNDWYIWQVEQIGWFGDTAFMVSHVDSGNPRWDDATARTHSKVIDGETHALRFGVFPKSGTLADYAVVRSNDTGYQTTIVDKEGASTSTTLESEGAFDELHYMLTVALMPKEKGQTFRLALYGAKDNSVWHVPLHVVGTDTLTDDAGNAHEVWVVHSPSTRPRKMRVSYVSDQPPYYFGTDTWDLMADATSPWHKFKSVTVLPDALDDEARAADGAMSSAH